MKIKTDTANKALFINGIYESVLKEIQNATKKHPQKSFYLQPYDAAQIVELRINTPSPENPLTLYASISTSLNEIYYEAEIIGWMDKKALFNAENKQKHDSILNDLNTYQPNEGGIFQTAGNSHCANLIVIRNLKKIAKPFPVSLLIKLSDGKSLKNRTRPGKWSAVLKKERVLDEAISYKPIFDKSFEDKIEKSLKESNTKRQQRLLQSNPVPTKSAILSYAFNRNPDVVAEVLIRAKGICELCHNLAPFIKASTGMPYLEVHHWTPLAEGGLDTIENAAALCPNCHKQAHFGEHKEFIRMKHALPPSFTNQ